MSMVPWVSYRHGTWLIDECQIAFFICCLLLRNLDPPFIHIPRLFVTIYAPIPPHAKISTGNPDQLCKTPMDPWTKNLTTYYEMSTIMFDLNVL